MVYSLSLSQGRVYALAPGAVSTFITARLCHIAYPAPALMLPSTLCSADPAGIKWASCMNNPTVFLLRRFHFLIAPGHCFILLRSQHSRLKKVFQ